MSKRIFQFSIKDELLGDSVNPDNFSLPSLEDFIKQVSVFLRGSSRKNLNEIKAEIKEGSLAVLVHDDTETLEDAFEDYTKIKENRSLNDIDPTRASIVQEWQKLASQNKNRSYSLGAGKSEDVERLFIDESTSFEFDEGAWVETEMYLYGKVFDMGGKSKTNVHIELENGNTIKASTKPETLKLDNENRLYKQQLVRIRAEQNIDTKDLRNEKFISFEMYNPVYDSAVHEKIIKSVKSAWSDVPDITNWVENLRGSNG